ncbi:Leucine-rich repeat protein 2 [Linum perenne]
MEATSLLVRRTIGLFVLLLAATLLKVEGQGSSTSDEQALTSLRSSLSDPDNVLNSWDPTLVDPCTWSHVTCNNDNRVTRLDLLMDNLSGPLVSDLGSLDQLQYLSLEDNKLNGEIPAELGNLKNLIALDLYNNSLSGSIPSSLGSSLQSLKFLNLEDNRLNGSIPTELGNLKNLVALNVSNNNLCGIAPARLLLIKYIDISNNPGFGKPCPSS